MDDPEHPVAQHAKPTNDAKKLGTSKITLGPGKTITFLQLFEWRASTGRRGSVVTKWLRNPFNQPHNPLNQRHTPLNQGHPVTIDTGALESFTDIHIVEMIVDPASVSLGRHEFHIGQDIRLDI